MKPRFRLLRNGPDDPVETSEVVSVAKDMIKVGNWDKALNVLAIQGGLVAGEHDQMLASVFFQAVVEELASGNRSAARKLFTQVRKLYRRVELPQRLRSLVKFTKRNIEVDMAVALGEDEEALFVTGHPNAYEGWSVEVGTREYTVVKNEEAAHKLAVEYVTDNLNDDPTIFNQAFLDQHIDQEALTKLVRDIVLEDDYVDDLDDDRFWDVAIGYARGFGGHLGDTTIPDEDEDGERPPPTSHHRDQLKEAMADEAADRAMDYLTDMLGEAEARAFVMQKVGINVEAAAEAAVQEDGPGNFLATYDGNINDTISGFCYWRIN